MDTSTHNSTCGHFYTWTLLHTDTSTHGQFYLGTLKTLTVLHAYTTLTATLMHKLSHLQLEIGKAEMVGKILVG